MASIRELVHADDSLEEGSQFSIIQVLLLCLRQFVHHKESVVTLESKLNMMSLFHYQVQGLLPKNMYFLKLFLKPFIIQVI